MSSHPKRKSEEKPLAEFQGYEPNIRSLGGASGGGFRLTIEISEDEWDNIRELNDPSLKNTPLKIIIYSDQQPL